MSRVGWKPERLRFCSAEHDADQARLVVERAAAEIMAVLLAELERIVLPVGGLGLDHVHVRHQQDRLLARRLGRRPADDHRLGLVMVLDDDVGDPGLAELGRRAARSACGIWPRPATVGISTTFSNRSRSALRWRASVCAAARRGDVSGGRPTAILSNIMAAPHVAATAKRRRAPRQDIRRCCISSRRLTVRCELEAAVARAGRARPARRRRRRAV